MVSRHQLLTQGKPNRPKAATPVQVDPAEAHRNFIIALRNSQREPAGEAKKEYKLDYSLYGQKGKGAVNPLQR